MGRSRRRNDKTDGSGKEKEMTYGRYLFVVVVGWVLKAIVFVALVLAALLISKQVLAADLCGKRVRLVAVGVNEKNLEQERIETERQANWWDNEQKKLEIEIIEKEVWEINLRRKKYKGGLPNEKEVTVYVTPGNPKNNTAIAEARIVIDKVKNCVVTARIVLGALWFVGTDRRGIVLRHEIGHVIGLVQHNTGVMCANDGCMVGYLSRDDERRLKQWYKRQ